MNKRDYAAELGALGYPKFSYIEKKGAPDAATFLSDTLSESDLDPRVAEGLPWVVLTNPKMDWEWLRNRVSQHRRQNGLGFVVELAVELANRQGDADTASILGHQLEIMELMLVAEESTFCHDSMTASEREWLRHHRSLTAAHWNILSDMKSEDL